MELRQLKPIAVPSTFPGLPAYYSTVLKKARSENTFFARRGAEAKRQLEASSSFQGQDEISSLSNLSIKLDSEFIPTGTLKALREDSLDKLCLYDFQHLNSDAPQFKYFMVTKNSLEFQAYRRSLKLNTWEYFDHIIRHDKLLRFPSHQHSSCFE